MRWRCKRGKKEQQGSSWCPIKRAGAGSLMQGSIPLVVRQVEVRTEITQHLSIKCTRSASPEQHLRGDFRVGRRIYVPGQLPRSPA